MENVRLLKENPGFVVRLLRTQMGLTQSQFGTLLDVPQVTVARWETGVHHPSHVHMRRIRQMLERQKGCD